MPGKPNKIALPKRWQRFPAAFAKNLDYWYFPKGLAVTPDAIRPRLEALVPLNGKPWREAQVDFIRSLNKAQISKAESEWEGGGAPLGRMLLQALRIVGLAWVNPVGRIEITEAGQNFLNASDPDKVLSNQLERYQFWNPTISRKAHEIIKLHPVPFFAEVMRTLTSPRIFAREYELFIARARSYDDLDAMIERIEDFRALPEDQQNELYRQCGEYMIGGKGRSSLINTVALNRPYAFSALTLSKLFEKDGTGLRFRPGALRKYRSFLHDYPSNHTFIQFDTDEEWIAYFGDPNAQPTKDLAMDYYMSKGDVQSAVALKKKEGASEQEVRQFRDMMLSETKIEDYLQTNLDYIGDAAGSELELVGRQYQTSVTKIDLLTKDKKTKDYFVVELKKGRSADIVYGQCSRYMGWVRKNLAEPEGVKVHGAIVAKTIDNKLKAARDAHDTKVALIEFSMKAHAKVIA
jgi:hypothetical protein